LNKIFWPTIYCWNAHLQFVPFIIKGIIDKYYNPPFQWFREIYPCPDGEELIVDWVVTSYLPTGLTESLEDDTPIIVLHHGAMCDTTDLPGQSYIQPAVNKKWIVCSFNRRGHAQPLKSPKWNFLVFRMMYIF
jgi:predicted alpha/beta-fold hydrolase